MTLAAAILALTAVFYAQAQTTTEAGSFRSEMDAACGDAAPALGVMVVEGIAVAACSDNSEVEVDHAKVMFAIARNSEMEWIAAKLK